MNPTLSSALSVFFEALLAALGLGLSAFLVAVAPALRKLVVSGAEYLASRVNIVLDDAHRKQLEWAVTQSVDAAQELGDTTLKNIANKGGAKLALAKKSVRSLAPTALAKLDLDDQQLEDVIHAAVARKRTSTPSYSLIPLSIAPTNPPASSSSSGNWEPVSAIDLPDGVPKPKASMPEPTLRGDHPLPPPARMPADPRAVPAREEELDTRPDRPGARRK